MTALRWPLHPRPGPVEALSSWLARTARLYGLSAEGLLRHNLDPASFTLAGRDDLDLDWDPPREILTALAERTGLGLHDLAPMTMAGWVPWLMDTLDPGDGQATFGSYVGGGSLDRAASARTPAGPAWATSDPATRLSPRSPACPAHPGPATEPGA